MKTRTAVNFGVTATLILMIAVNALTYVAAKAPINPLPKQLLEGKNLVSAKRCNTCHGPTLTGVQSFSPSLQSNGVLKEYNIKSFEVVMASGKTNDGGMVQKPMPIYHLKPAQSDALYGYLKSLK